jgi:sulfate/thiosulfate transport system permease protein
VSETVAAGGAATAPGSPVTPPPKPSRFRSGRGVSSGGGTLSLGLATIYMCVIVLIPLAAVVDQAFTQGLGTLWSSITNKQAVEALLVTLGTGLATALIGAIMGTLIAWVLVRDDFPGKAIVNAIIDLPFALPSIVTSLTLLLLYGPASPVGLDIDGTRVLVVIALMFVTLPFVVRSVQPVLMALDLQAEEAAASLGASNFTIFRRVILPSLSDGIVSGAALSFARAVGEIGSLVLIAGKVTTVPLLVFTDIGSDSQQAAASLSLALMVISLALLVTVRRFGGRIVH